MNDSIIRKMEEYKDLNNKLAEISKKIEAQQLKVNTDNKLDTFNDIKQTGEFIKSIDGLSTNDLFKYSNYILEITLILDHIITKTIDNIIDIPIKNENLNPEKIIKLTLSQAIKKYEIENFNIYLGDLYPINQDKDLIHQLFINLIFNTIKHSDKEKLVNLEIFSKIDDKNIVYYIKDNNMKLSENNLFNLLKRIANKPINNFDNLGLKVISRLTERLNAKISFDDNLGTGSTFIISFPNE